jgi:hypothetical protein
MEESMRLDDQGLRALLARRVLPLSDVARIDNYLRQRGVVARTDLPRSLARWLLLTPRQRRRVQHKRKIGSSHADTV